MKNLSHVCCLCNSNNLKNLFEKGEFSIAKCYNCGMMFCNPMPDDKYVLDYYENMSFPMNPMNETKSLHKDVLSYIKIKIPKEGRILDVGCSEGHFLKLAKSFGYYGICTEFGKTVAQFARDVNRIEVIETPVHELYPAYSEYFDCITMINVIEHFTDPQREIETIYKLLKENGLLIIITCNANFGLYFRWLEKLVRNSFINNRISIFSPPSHLYYFTPATLKKFLSVNKFKNIKVFNAPVIRNANLNRSIFKFLSYNVFEVLSLISHSKIIGNYSILCYAIK